MSPRPLRDGISDRRGVAGRAVAHGCELDATGQRSAEAKSYLLLLRLIGEYPDDKQQAVQSTQSVADTEVLDELHRANFVFGTQGYAEPVGPAASSRQFPTEGLNQSSCFRVSRSLQRPLIGPYMKLSFTRLSCGVHMTLSLSSVRDMNAW
jgi:hypothetical protein